MPELSTTLMLDILLGLIILLFVPFGIRRGVAKEAMVSAGILLGAAIAAAWGPRAGEWLSGATGMSAGTATFVASLAALLAGTFLLGYGGGAAVREVRPGALSRIAGALLAAMNGAVFLGYLLRFIDDNLSPGAALAEGYVTSALMNRFPELLLAFAGLALLFTVIGWIVNGIRGGRSQADPALPVRTRPVKSGAGADGGKVEPVPAEPARMPSALGETAPIPSTAADVWRAPAGANGNGSASEWARPGAAAMPAGSAASTWSSWGRADSEPIPAGAPADDRRRCATCGALAGPGDLYCPECGKTL